PEWFCGTPSSHSLHMGLLLRVESFSVNSAGNMKPAFGSAGLSHESAVGVCRPRPRGTARTTPLSRGAPCPRGHRLLPSPPEPLPPGGAMTEPITMQIFSDYV